MAKQNVRSETLRNRIVLSWLLVSLVSAVSWIVCETLGGLAFLAAGIRLWRYHLVPLFFDITSPCIWLIVFLVMGPIMLLYSMVETRRGFAGSRRIIYRILLLVIVGPIAEVLINQFIFKGLWQRPLYSYTVFPTFEGSGSLLSPFYYLTLYIHYPVTEWLQRPPTGSYLQLRSS